MLKTIRVDLSATNLELVGKDSNIDGVDNSEMDGIKVRAISTKSKNHDKSKCKNLANSFSAKLQASV